MVALETYYLHVNKVCLIRYELKKLKVILLVRNIFCLLLGIGT